MAIKLDNVPLATKEPFLSNKANTTRLIDKLTDAFLASNINVIRCKDDADTKVVETALDLAETRMVRVKAEDTDILVLLISHHNKSTHHPVYFDCKKGCFNINDIAEALPARQKKYLLVCHAFTGCDTTSGLSGHGKAKLLEVLCSGEVDDALDVFSNPNATKPEIQTSGEALFKHIHHGSESGDGTLAELRFNRFNKQAKVGVIRPETLPPTSGAALQHSLRSYLQVQDWMQLRTMSLPVLEYGWKIEAGRHEPVTTSDPIAPENLIKLICCNCTGECDNMRCSCRKNGLACVAACG